MAGGMPDGTTADDGGTTVAGWHLPGYRLGRVLGRGGFATVYAAEQLSLGRQVAVKVLLADLATPADRRRFDRERVILARLGGHPHVVDVYDAGLTGENRPYIVMRLYRGGSLASRLRRDGPLPLDQTLTLITKIAAALDTAHDAGVLHRDVKPENILLTDTGDPVLTDFGISSLAEPQAATHTSTAFVTVAHAAPEILERQRYSVASDVYALASTTYHLLTGKPAFDGGWLSVARILTDDPPPLTRPDLPPTIRTAVETALRHGMAKQPDHRPPTAGDLARALTEAATATPAAEPAVAPKPPAPSRPDLLAEPPRARRSGPDPRQLHGTWLTVGGALRSLQLKADTQPDPYGERDGSYRLSLPDVAGELAGSWTATTDQLRLQRPDGWPLIVRWTRQGEFLHLRGLNGALDVFRQAPDVVPVRLVGRWYVASGPPGLLTVGEDLEFLLSVADRPDQRGVVRESTLLVTRPAPDTAYTWQLEPADSQDGDHLLVGPLPGGVVQLVRSPDIPADLVGQWVNLEPPFAVITLGNRRSRLSAAAPRRDARPRVIGPCLVLPDHHRKEVEFRWTVTGDELRLIARDSQVSAYLRA